MAREDHQEIVGGQATTEYLGVAQIKTKLPDGYSFKCSATLISPRVLLTASHCIDPSYIGDSVLGVEARFGAASIDDPSFVEIIEVIDQLWYPEWSFQRDDIALLLLEHDAIAAPLPYNATPLSDDDLGTMLTLVGWGITASGESDHGIKRIAEGPLVSYESAQVLRYGDGDGATCSGDSGGPGLALVGGEMTVVSVTSSHSGGDCAAYPGSSGGMRVAYYSDVISDFIAENDSPTPPMVAIDEPRDAAEVPTSFTIRASAMDDFQVARVDFYFNGNLIATVAAPPYEAAVTDVDLGDATIEVKAVDNRGDVADDHISVTIIEADDSPDDTDDIPAVTDECTSDDECGSGEVCNDRGSCIAAAAGGCSAAHTRGGGWALLAMVFFAAIRRRKQKLALA